MFHKCQTQKLLRFKDDEFWSVIFNYFERLWSFQHVKCLKSSYHIQFTDVFTTLCCIVKQGKLYENATHGETLYVNEALKKACQS